MLVKTAAAGPLDVDALLARNKALYGDLRMEADPDAGDTADTSDADTSGSGTGDQGKGADTGGWDGNVDSLPPAAQKIISDLRKEAGDNRVAKNAAQTEAEKRTQDMARALAKAAGIELPDDKIDPEKLQKALEDEQAKTAAKDTEARSARVELAVFKGAGKHQGDPSALLDSRSFLDSVKDLDPTDGEFASKVDKAIEKAIKANPKLKAGRAPGASGADHTGGSGERRTTPPQSLADAVAGHYGTA